MNPLSETSSPGGTGLTLTRREALRRLVVLTGVTMVGAHALLRGASLASDKTAAGFTDADRALLDELGETIIPATDIPGAKATQIGAFMTMMVTDCYNPAEHAVFAAGIPAVDAAAQKKFGKGFLDCSPAQRADVANALDLEAKSHEDAKKTGEPSHYFRMMKELTVLGYFSSEIGCTQAVRYIEVPGAYHGDVPYKKGDPAWF